MPPQIMDNSKFKQGMSSVKNLNPSLLLKISKSQISPTLADTLLDNSAGNVPSTQAVKEVNDKTVLNTSRIDNLIDDSATGGTDKLWSINKLKDYIAEEDDTYFTATLAERDDDSVGLVIPKRQGIRVFVADAAADPLVGTDANGVAYGANYIYDGSSWTLIRAVQYRQIDVTPYIRYDEVIDDLTSTETQKPLSANQGRILKDMIVTSASSLTMVFDDVEATDGGVLNLTRVARGQAPNGIAYVGTDEGLVPVFVDVAADGKSATIIEDDTALYVGLTARISYLTDGTTVDVPIDTGAGGDGLVIP